MMISAYAYSGFYRLNTELVVYDSSSTDRGCFLRSYFGCFGICVLLVVVCQLSVPVIADC